MKTNTEILKNIYLQNEQPIQPDWIKEKFPSYIQGHGHHRLSSIREAHFKGKHIKVKTTYVIEIDGKHVVVHARVDNQGKVHCHTTPYEPYDSVIDLIKMLLDKFPDSLPVDDKDDHNGGYNHHL